MIAAWAQVVAEPTSAAPPRPQTTSGLAVSQRMCSSPEKAAFSTTSGSFVEVVSCSLTVPTAGTVFVSASASAGMNPNAGTAIINVRLGVDGLLLSGSNRDITLRSDLQDGSARNLSTQISSNVGAGLHSFTMEMARIGGAGTPRLIDPVITAFFVADAGSDVLGCASPGIVSNTIDQLADEFVTSCSINVPAPGTVFITASSGIERTDANARMITSLKMDAMLILPGQPGILSANSSAVDTLNYTTVSQMGARGVTAGIHNFSWNARATSVTARYTMQQPSLQVIFVPATSEDTSICSFTLLASVAGPAEGGPLDVVSCSITLPRPGTIQVRAGGLATATLSEMEMKVDLNMDGAVVQHADRYMNLYGTSGLNPTNNTVATQAQRSLAAGTYKLTMRYQRFFGTGALSMSEPWIVVLAAFDPPPAPPPTPDYIPVVPERLLDTRPATQVGYTGPKPVAEQTVELQVTGVGTTSLPADAKAVVLNVTGSEAVADGFATVWPCGSPRPTASNLNVKANANVPNLVVAKVGDGGKVCIFTQNSQHLIADINGYMPGTSKYVPVVPDRVLETRQPAQVGYAGAKPGAGQTIELTVTGTGTSLVPADALAVVVNVTGTEAEVDGFATVWPCGSPQPTASNLNLVVGTDRPNLVVTKIGTAGKVCIFTQNAGHFVADINGYMPAGTKYVSLVPSRILETRPPTQAGYAGDKPAAGSTVQLHVVGTGSPAVPGDATAVVLNVTGTEATADGFVTVWPCGAPQPTASNLNLTAGSTAPNLVMSKIGAGGDVCLFTQSGTHLVADLAGFWPST